ncbi:Gfo/Idh/MocA family protein [Listeria booriae]|uniref:Gfo/Idh/MocA family protein n=1 Tax=Listeria booriae TaxID=1552123 RepID=UPI0016247312|nr:Gfo/Idh/MocA family oxidoreductase [Listeria booriae]MBC1503170.1 Gfo/Idh/MocA family oxidoreductase [Listeria booriae]
MEMKNLVIVGFGGMGTYHVELVGAAEGITVTGVYDIAEARLQVAKEKGLQTYPSFEAVLADEAVDAVLIATPNDSHKDLAIQALEAGKNVVCEKPVTITSADLEAILAVAKKENKTFMVHQNRRWDSDFLIVRDMVQKEAQIGNVFHVESRVQGANGIPGDWRHLKAQGGGMVLDWGVHLLDQLLFMIDSRIKTVSANLSFILGDEVDDGFTSFITFENGTTALIEVGTTNYVKLPRWYVKGTEGTAVIQDWDLSGEIIAPDRTVAKVEPKPIQAGQGLTKTMAPPSEESTTRSPIVQVAPDMAGFYDNFAAVLNGTAEPIVKNEEVHRVLRLIEAIFEAGEEGKVVYFNE